MSKSEYFVAAILVFTASLAAVSAMRPQQVVLNGAVLQVSEVVAAEHRHALRSRNQHTGFSMQCELGNRVLSIQYSSKLEE